jgi:putative ABC transport system permease protein
MVTAERVYRALLFCYPAEFRCEYAAEMAELFRERWNEERSPWLWFEILADIAISATREHGQMLWNDIRYTARTLRKAPLFTAAAIVTLALGIGANTAIFSVVNAVLLRPLPFGAPGRLVNIAEKNEKLNLHFFGASVLNYLSWKEQSWSFERMGVIGFATFSLTGKGEPEQLTGTTISPSIFPLLAIRPVVGRAFREEEERPGSPPVAIVSEGLWKSHFAADPGIAGRQITMNGTSYTIVGVAPAALQVFTNGDVWVPLTIDRAKEARLNHVVNAVGLLKPGVTLEQAQSEMDLVARRVGAEYPEVRDWGIQLRTFYHWFVPDQLRTALLVLLGAVAFVLLIACANVANLLLSRAAGRQREIAVRTAMGATRGRLLRQLLTESLLLSLAGGAAGVAAAAWAVHAMSASLPANLLPVSDLDVDQVVLGFALGASLVTGLLFGLAPAWQTAKTDLNAILKQGGRSGTGGARPVLRNALVAGELALATMLLIGAGLLMQSLLRLQRVDTGFEADHLLTFQVSPPLTRYPPVKARAFYQALAQSLCGIPGVRAAALSSGIPMGGGSYTRTPTAPVGHSLLPPGEAIPIDWRLITPGLFQTLGIPLLRGRDFTDQDTPEAPQVAILSQQTARKLWGEDDPLGRVIRVVGSGREFTVIGVVGDARMNSLDQKPQATMYFPVGNRLAPVMDVAVRTQGRPEDAMPAIRRKVHELDAELPISTVRTMDRWLANNAAQPRLNSLLLGAFACVALLIAAVGIYGVLSYSVTQRTREIGLRMALGAPRSEVLRMIVGEGMRMGTAGIAAGIAGAVVVSRTLASMLFGIDVRDPVTYAGVAGILAAIALVACYLPARRATSIDPVVALREE